METKSVNVFDQTERGICDVFSGMEYALAKHDFHYGIRADAFDDLFRLSLSDDPRNEFVDEELEQGRVQLMELVRDFRQYFSLYVALDGEKYYPSLHFQPGVKQDDPHKAELEEEISVLNRKSTEICEAYKAFVRLVRRKKAGSMDLQCIKRDVR